MSVKIRERDGCWWLFVDHQGHRKAKKIGSGRRAKKLAEDAAVKITARLLDGDLRVFDTTPAEAPPTFDEVYAEWRVKYPATHAVAESTFANYCSFVEHHLRPYFGSMPITAITVETIEDFIAAKRTPGGSIRRVGKPLADSSLRTGLLPLRLILKRAVRRKLIPANPMNDAEWRGTARTENVDPFTGRELRAIFAAADRLEPDFAALLRLWGQTGMRAGEATGLQWQDLDLNAGTVKVRRTFSHGKIGPTKTRQERDVSITHPIADDVAEWRPGGPDAARAVLHGLRRVTVRSLEPEAFVFHRGGQPLSSMEVHRAWKRVLLAAQVRYRMPEQLRHTFASTMLSRNAPLLYVQQQGGWRSASVLLRTYARWMPQPSATQAQPTVENPTVSEGRNAR
ncbi:MAG TPA: site-specific integrase [Methylomirabilota bacterium]